MAIKSTKSSQQLIADNLKISRTTVSRCFTNHSGVNPNTRAEVFSEARRIGYTYLEQRNDKRHTKTKIGVIICSEKNELDSTYVQSPAFNLMPGISEYALIHDLNIESKIISPKLSKNSPEFIQIIKEVRKNWDGALLIYPFKSEIISALKNSLPCVSLVEQFGDHSLDCVDVDHYRGISLITQKLIEKGHKRFGFLSRKYSIDACWSYRRFSALTDKLMRLGETLNKKDVINIYPGSFLDHEASLEKAIEQTRDGVTAWVCAADHIGYELIAKMNEVGIRVPEDVSIVGFDGIKSPNINHQLSTIKLPHREIGYNAIKRLCEKIKNPYYKVCHISINGEFVNGTTI